MKCEPFSAFSLFGFCFGFRCQRGIFGSSVIEVKKKLLQKSKLVKFHSLFLSRKMRTFGPSHPRPRSGARGGRLRSLKHVRISASVQAWPPLCQLHAHLLDSCSPLPDRNALARMRNMWTGGDRQQCLARARVWRCGAASPQHPAATPGSRVRRAV